ncbi:retinitis pigmentosa gtpase regulator a-related [Anaeramoeba flamelloides]|uniref:Retinitis pigmentosa gtpase regulator a-related n=1 Tax=Anaeramoeba flamelloides TaxID=1746091 RepID=A0AAV7ZW18_9EUKA|nr:retinitis pigmentosa gtpase regulator a-related [Anaeramoeba flamelloides]
MIQLTFSPELISKDIEQAKNDFKGVTPFRKRLKMLHKWRPKGVIGLDISNLKKTFLKRTPKTAILQPIKIKRDCINDLVLLTNKPKKSIERGLATFFKKYFLLHNISNYSREWLIFGPEGYNLDESFGEKGDKIKIKSKPKMKIKTKQKLIKKPSQMKNRKKHKRQLKKWRTNKHTKGRIRNKSKANAPLITPSSKETFLKRKSKQKTKINKSFPTKIQIKKKKKLQLKNKKQKQKQKQKRSYQNQISKNKKLDFSLDKTKLNWFPLDSFVNSDFSDFHTFFNENMEKSKLALATSSDDKKKVFNISLENNYLSHNLNKDNFGKEFDLEEEFTDFEFDQKNKVFNNEEKEEDNGYEKEREEEEKEEEKEEEDEEVKEEEEEYLSTPKVKKHSLITKRRSPNVRKRLFHEDDQVLIDLSRSPAIPLKKSFKKNHTLSNPKKILRNPLQIHEFSNYKEYEEQDQIEMNSPISHLSSPDSSFSFSISSDLESDNDLFKENQQTKQAQLQQLENQQDKKRKEDQREDDDNAEFWDLSSPQMDLPEDEWFGYTNPLTTYDDNNYQQDLDFDIISGLN